MDAITPKQSDDFGAFLAEKGVLNDKALNRARRAFETAEAPLHVVAERLGLAREETLLAALSEFLELPLLKRPDFPSTPVLAESLDPVFLKKHGLLPIKETVDGVVIAFADPTDPKLMQAIEFHLEKPIKRAIASVRDIEWGVQSLYGNDDATPSQNEPSNDDIETLKNLATEQPVIRFVNRLIESAIEQRASDIHLEPEERRLQVRYRIDGVLINGEAPAPAMAAAITSRIKIMARLNIAERRLPQDGRIRINVRGAEVDLRVSTTPTLHGESVVLRVLDKSAVTLEFSALGFDELALERYQDLLSRPNGVLLVTGPTGSGKTTTLYTSLKSLNDGRRKIFSVEDPIEYQVAGVNQIHAQPQIGLDFARALRSILRQDPDIIMIGEIRDVETAEIAIQSALTGHLVIATLHTNTAAATITRLIDMGIEDYLLASTVVGVAAQRLVRTLCRTCALPDKTVLDLVAKISPAAITRTTTPAPKRAVGCKACQSTGFKGRTSIIEVMPVSKEIRRAVMSNASDADIEALAVSQGMLTMLEAGLEKVLNGSTTLDEVLQVAKMR